MAYWHVLNKHANTLPVQDEFFYYNLYWNFDPKKMEREKSLLIFIFFFEYSNSSFHVRIFGGVSNIRIKFPALLFTNNNVQGSSWLSQKQKNSSSDTYAF